MANPAAAAIRKLLNQSRKVQILPPPAALLRTTPCFPSNPIVLHHQESSSSSSSSSSITNNNNNNPNPIPSLLNPTAPAANQIAKPFHFYYPCFPFGLSLNPISLSGFHPMQAAAINADGGDEAIDGIDSADDDAGTVWRADSVKKKRKKKMNKHKYKKLRKRLRRQAD